VTALKNGRETGVTFVLTPVPQPLCTKAFQAKTGPREGYFTILAGYWTIRTGY